MLAESIAFPHAGSRGFLAETADPVTIIRRNADGSALVRLDPKPFHARNRDASGNRTVPGSDLFPTEREAFEASMAKTATRKRKGRAGK